MTSTEQTISYTIAQPIVGTLSNDDLTMPLKLDRAFETMDAVSSSYSDNDSATFSQKTEFDLVNGQFAGTIDQDRNGDYIKIAHPNDINQKINVEDAMSPDSNLATKNWYGDASATSTYRLTNSPENQSMSNQTLNAEETEMQTDRLSNDRLVMHLKFEETAGTLTKDSSPSGINKAELRNGATFKNEGSSFGGVVSFDGANDYINVSDSNTINLNATAERTIALSFKVDDKNIANRKQVIYEEGGTQRGLNIYIDNGRLYVGGWNTPESEGNWKGSYISTDAIASGQWHHLTLVLDADAGSKTLQEGALSAYLDGSQFGTAQGVQLQAHLDNTGIGGVNQATKFHDGDARGTGTNGLKGSIDDVRVYNRVLTDEEIATLGSKSEPAPEPSPNPEPTPQPEATNNRPVAAADKATTKEDTPITILASRLLANDRDADGDRLKITGVKNTTNGTATVDSKGNVIFSPNDNFNGNGSFQYTVTDGRGGTSQATVTVSVTAQPEPAAASVNIGTNLMGIANWSSQLPFVDSFKSSRPWLTQKKNVWDTKEASRLDLDKNGWVKSLPDAGDGVQYNSVGTIMHRDIEGKYPGGKYIVLYDGEGTINYGLDATKDAAASRKGRDVVNVKPSDFGVWLNISETDPRGTGNYIRNIRFIPAAYENTYKTQPFNPTFLDKVKDFSTFRFMDWMKTNNSTQSEWSDRPTPQTSTYASKGVAIETIVQLANQTDTDAWINIPHLATNDYVTNIARYIKNNLEPGRKLYVELGNEMWNGEFQQAKWAREQGKTVNGNSEFSKQFNFISKRTTEITQTFDRVFGADKERVIGVMAGQASNVWVSQQLLDYKWTDKPLSSKAYGIDAIAIGPYFGYYLGKPETASQVQSWTRNADGGLNKLFDEITKGGVLRGGPKGGALQQAYDNIKAHADLAQREGVQLIAYEGGQHLTGIRGVENNSAVVNLFAKANRDPRMGEIYRDYLQKWSELGGDLFMNFNDISKPNKYGNYGLLDYANQTSSPKYDAVMDIINSSS